MEMGQRRDTAKTGKGGGTSGCDNRLESGDSCSDRRASCRVGHFGQKEGRPEGRVMKNAEEGRRIEILQPGHPGKSSWFLKIFSF